MNQNTTSHLCPDASNHWDTSGLLVSGPVRQAEELLGTQPGGNWQGLLLIMPGTDLKNRKRNIPFHLSSGQISLRLPGGLGKVTGEYSLESEGGHMFAGAAAAAVMPPQRRLRNSRGVGGWGLGGLISHLSQKTSVQALILQYHFLLVRSGLWNWVTCSL